MKDRILRVAKEKFLRYGFNKVSIDSLVSDLRTSKSSIYNYFDTKEDLVGEVLDQINNDINNQLDTILYNKKLSFYGKLEAITEFTSNLLEETDDRFLDDLRVYTPDLWENYLQMREKRVNKYYKELFRTGLEAGLIRNDLDLDLIVQAYFKLTEISVHSGYYKNLNLSAEETYKQISTLFLEGISLD